MAEKDAWTRAYDEQIRASADAWLTDEEKDQFVADVQDTDQYKAALDQHEEAVKLEKEVVEARAEEARDVQEVEDAAVKPAEQTGYSEDVAAGVEPSTTTPVDDALEAKGVEVDDSAKTNRPTRRSHAKKS